MWSLLQTFSQTVITLQGIGNCSLFLSQLVGSVPCSYPDHLGLHTALHTVHTPPHTLPPPPGTESGCSSALPLPQGVVHYKPVLSSCEVWWDFSQGSPGVRT